MRAGRTLVVDEVPADEFAAYEAVGIRAYVAVPLVREGQIVAYLAVNHTTPHAWTVEEIALIEETAERTWAAVERARAEAALRESETKYRHLFETVGDGICLIEIIEDGEGCAVDYRYVDVNAQFGRHTGLTDVVGRRSSEVTPDNEVYWVDANGAVARTGETRRFENYHQATGRWYEVQASRIMRGHARSCAASEHLLSRHHRAQARRRGAAGKRVAAARRPRAGAPGHRVHRAVGRDPVPQRDVRRAMRGLLTPRRPEPTATSTSATTLTAGRSPRRNGPAHARC